MPYDEAIAERIRQVVAGWKNTSHKKMFGGVCHLLNGNMFCGVYKEFLILRLGEDAAADALEQEHVNVFDITGRPMRGWVMVDRKGFKSDAMLKKWLDQAKAFVAALPPKKAAPRMTGGSAHPGRKRS
jgi:TfoX/Sxy family transcriptional regulator of competence genes